MRRFQSCRELMEALEDASFDVTTNQEKLAQWKRILAPGGAELKLPLPVK